MTTGLATAVYGFAHYPDLAMPIAIGGVVGMYLVAAWGAGGGPARRRVAVVVAVVMTLPRADADVVDAAFVSLSLAGAWVLGDRARAAGADRRAPGAGVAAGTGPGRGRPPGGGLRARPDRPRAAHVVAHHVSMMVVQAEAGLVAVATEPARAAGAFEAIAATGRQALVEMRRLLGVLRGDGDQAPASPPARPGRGAVAGRAGRAAGLRVELVVEGAQEPLPAGVDLSAYRIVQEALTNAVSTPPGPGPGAGPLRRGRPTVAGPQRGGRPAGRREQPERFGGGWSIPTGRLWSATGRSPVGAGRHARAGAPVRGELHAGPGPDGGFTVDARPPIRGQAGERAAHQGPGGRRPGAGPGRFR